MTHFHETIFHCDSKQLVYPVTSTEFCSQQPDQLQPPFRSCCLEVVAHLSSMGKHQGWQVVSTPFREPWMEPRGMGAMCPCANTCRNTPAPELYIYNYVYIYIYWYMASIIKMICCHHDQFLVWLGVARFGYWIQIHTTQPKIKTRLHYPIYVDGNWPQQSTARWCESSQMLRLSIQNIWSSAVTWFSQPILRTLRWG